MGWNEMDEFSYSVFRAYGCQILNLEGNELE